ncbi:MAG: IS200/IS605 family transposase [Microcoleaceae cyanobacterium]
MFTSHSETLYRGKVLTDDILSVVESRVFKTLEKNNCELIEFNGESDHLHLLFQDLPQYQLSKLVNFIKTATSRVLSNTFSDIWAAFGRKLKKVDWAKKVLWISSYYISSCGGVMALRPRVVTTYSSG